MAHVASVGKNIFMLGSTLPGANLYRFAKWPLNKLVVAPGFRRKNRYLCLILSYLAYFRELCLKKMVLLDFLEDMD